MTCTLHLVKTCDEDFTSLLKEVSTWSLSMTQTALHRFPVRGQEELCLNPLQHKTKFTAFV